MIRRSGHNKQWGALKGHPDFLKKFGRVFRDCGGGKTYAIVAHSADERGETVAVTGQKQHRPAIFTRNMRVAYKYRARVVS